jgi:signal transduction histidine kinase
VIHPPWWQTWWFRSFLAISAIGLLWLIYHIRVTRLLEIERMRVRIASDLHDDIGSTLTRIAISSEVIQASDNLDRMREAALKIGHLSREVVRTFSDIIWSIDARNDKFGDLLARIQDMAYQILSPKEIIFTLDAEGIDKERTLPVDVRQNLYLICKEALHNASKYSGATQVRMTIANADGLLAICIRDNGRGLPENLPVRGNGLKNMQMRARRIDGQVEYLNDNGLTVKLVTKEMR